MHLRERCAMLLEAWRKLQLSTKLKFLVLFPRAIMKRSIFLNVAAALGVAAAFALPAQAQVSAGLQQSAFGGTAGVGGATGFSALSNVGGTRVEGATIDANGVSTGGSTVITTGGGGRVGTFQASLSEGDQQRFAVGTSTNISVNASSSSTSDYQTNSTATLGIGSSNLRQTIGTSGVNETASARESAASSYADTSVGRSASSYFESAKSAISLDSTQQNRFAWWRGNMATQSFDQATSNTESGSQIESSYNTEHGNARNEYASSSTATQAANGVITGSFVASSATTGTETLPADNSQNQVTVSGIGNNASVNAQANSVFNSSIIGRAGTPAVGTSGTASGSAGANVSSTASADASATKFSSVFLQSF